ncbi:nuclease-related domain-containing DEAD/DEAH box helicase [Mycolicibacter arupensis]|jgi:hypothetical protein|uniref:NERD nuclease n=1 Tax=Mycolicibacter arupensis TaxID=342002 RepID=A0A5B1M7Z1_9MYCO|nr:NERD domain-containing protein [Mycolicibacter arupensis]KAA1428119.1 NERD nuclease [Mycolicibacter arupensis]TXI54334.1 MAG: NERD nuclease [Mycolicibacter arupensis]
MILVPDLPDIVRLAQSDAERRVARLLKSVEGPQDAVAFYSLNLRSHPYKAQAEADFVLLWRGVLIVVEVKGGGVQKFEGTWYTIDRRGDWHKLDEAPMKQAQSAKYALQDIFGEDGIGWFANEAIVITPDIDAPPPAIEWKSTHWLSSQDMTIAGLTKSLDIVADTAKPAPPRKKLASANTLRDKLFGHFTRMPVIDAQRGAVLEEQNRATEQQARVLASLARNQRVMVLGGAGTGKSLVLAVAALQEAATGRSVLITFRSPDLARFFERLITNRDIDLIPFADLPEQRRWDVVLIDEAQDLMNDEAMDQLDAVIAGGRATGRWRMFLDPNNQAHLDGQFDADVYELVTAEAIPFDLNLNVRNTRAIVHVVQEYLGADVGDPAIVHGEKIEWHWSDSPADVDRAAEVARHLIARGAQRSSIWIISATATSAPTKTRDGIVVTNSLYAKGLEAEHVVVCELPTDYDDKGVAAFYVAVTRARVALHIVATAEDKDRLQRLARQWGTLT